MSHEHEHYHEHHDCGCHDCGCGCSHEEPKNKHLDTALLIIAAVLFVLTFVLPSTVSILKLIISIIATLLAGHKTFIAGIKSLLKFHFDESLLLTIAVVAAFILGESVEAVAVTILFTLGQKIEDYAVDRSQKSIDKLSQIQAKTANRVLGDGTVEVVDVDDIKIGDTLLIKAGERVPVDCEIISGSSSFDTSAITGESIPADLKAGDTLLSGTVNLTGAVECSATADFDCSTASQIVELVKMSNLKKSKTQKIVTRFAEIYTPTIMVLALLVALLPPILNLGGFEVWIYRALVFLVASCPCAIVISIPLAFFSAIGRASKAGIFVKGSRDIEALAAADAFLFDKTGTLTSGDFSLTQIEPASGFSKEELLTFAANAEQYSDHPVARAIVAGAGEFEKYDCENVRETSGQGIEVSVAGKEVACGNRTLMERLGITIPSVEGSMFVAIGGEYAGTITVEDTLREDSVNTLKALKNLGVKKTVMLTGDSQKNAEKTAKECKVDEYRAQLLPQDKLTVVEELQRQGAKTAFVGDGINDAPVISQSDVGIAVGRATDIVSSAADVVLTGSSLSSVIKAVKIARRTMSTVRFNFAFAIIVKAAVLILDVIGFSNMWLAVLADVGVTIIAVLIAMRLLYTKV